MTINAIRLAELVAEALERTAFVLCEPAELDDAGLSETATFEALAAVDYRGVRTGVVMLGASPGFCAELAAGLLGTEPDQTSEQDGREALAELANMAAGSVVASLGGERDAIRLSVPRRPDADEFRRIQSRGVCCQLDSVGEPLRILLLEAA